MVNMVLFIMNSLTSFVLSVILLISCIVQQPTTVSAQDTTQENLATRMRTISEDLNRQLEEIMVSQALNYTSINATGLPYNATTKFYSKGMGRLYNATNMFMDIIQSKQAYPEGLITVDNKRHFHFADPAKEWKIIISHYGGLTGLAFAGLLLAAILPCVGLFFFCCRCAGHCGARSQPFDKKHDQCRKIILNMFLIAVATMILYGVVCAFVTNEFVQDGTETLPYNAKISLKDVELYLETTKRQINNLLITNYDELQNSLNNTLQASGKIVTEKLEVYSHAVSLTNLKDIVSCLDNIGEDLRVMHNITKDLRTNASQLDIVVRGVKKDLLRTLGLECKTQMCQQILHDYKINELSVQIDFNKLPNVTLALRNITWLMEGNIVAEVQKGRDSFTKIQRDIQHAVNETIPVVSSSIKQAGESLAITANNITTFIDSISDKINRILIPHLDIANDNIDKYSIYRYYVGLSVSGVLLLILTCITFGLFCGICGKRPDGYGDCCDKGSGACFLMTAVWFIFLLTSILIVITIGHMITGIVVQRGICEPLKNPYDNRIFKLADDYLQVNKLLYKDNPDADINIGHILKKCHENETIYKVLKLEIMYKNELEKVKNFVEKYSISSTIDQLRQKINLSPGIVILSDNATLKLNDLAQSGLSDIEFYRYAELLKENFTNINLSELGNKLRNLANQLPDNQNSTKNDLLKNAHDLEHYHNDLVIPMRLLSEQLSIRALKLEDNIKFNHSSMSEAIHSLIDEVQTAQKFLNEDGPEYVQLLAVKFSDAFVKQINDFLEHLINNARGTIGRCGPVSNAYNATLVAGCNKIVDPFNGFWLSVGWCLIFFIPTIIISVKLSALYKKSDPYPGPLVESEYLYDAYADRDNMLLAPTHVKKHNYRYHPHAYAEGYDGPIPTSGPARRYASRERVDAAHQGTSQHDSRYSDRAPKNWDFPNGGPPRYQPPADAPPPSTEYERPPPYYYHPEDRN
ncbi:prominin-like protein isoform X2 [Aphidius gifuensis]|uniref:prominin-like protein isoform X2 n=1 Tax=Aphidius gifuensis TaxID=684658 RepID=UPI001CDB52C6|nr:prominin-like protein isoform X2 [Aphidius gifuensis]